MNKYKLVPLEPTRKMLAAARGKQKFIADTCQDETNSDVYQAMLAAAPTLGLARDEMLTAMVDAAMVEMQNMHPPMRRSDCERLIHAAYLGKLPGREVDTSHRGDQKIVDQTEQVAAMLADRLFSSRLDDGFLYRDSMHPKAIACWEAACMAQDILTETDAENAVAMLECEESPEHPVEPAPVVQGDPAEQHNHKRIGWELDRTAMGDGYYGNALRVAKDIPVITDQDRAVLDRYATGAQHDTDHIALQDIAMRVYAATQPAEQQPAPDVAALVEALEQCVTSMLDSGYSKDSVAVRAGQLALAAYRKQEPKQ